MKKIEKLQSKTNLKQTEACDSFPQKHANGNMVIKHVAKILNFKNIFKKKLFLEKNFKK
jgi:hypothetical protein